jgi:HPt (histidine-containing phosphotransfer) domain-containing protein
MPLSHSARTREYSATRSPWALPNVLSELISDGYSGVVLDLIGIFEADTAQRLSAMRIAAAVGDRKALNAQAHSARGSSRQMGAVALAATFERLELGSSDLTASQLMGYLENAEREFPSVCREMALFSRGLRAADGQLAPVWQAEISGVLEAAAVTSNPTNAKFLNETISRFQAAR